MLFTFMERGPNPGPTVTLASEPGPHTDRKWTGTAVRPGKGTGQCSSPPFCLENGIVARFNFPGNSGLCRSDVGRLAGQEREGAGWNLL